MAAKIQFARGYLPAKNEKGMIEGEPFWVARTSDSTTANSEYTKWDEGTLYIGRPSLNSKTESPIAIGGVRSQMAAVYRGELSTESAITDDIFKHARKGDFYIFSTDAINGTFHSTNDFRKDDILLITSIGDGESNINSSTGLIIDQTLIQYQRVNASGGYADDVYFKKDATNNFDQFDADNAQDALLELQYEKLQYAGTIGSTADIPTTPTIGGLYLLTADDISFQGASVAFTCDKGDFVYWYQSFVQGTHAQGYTKKESYWVHIPSGYTNADEIDYYDADRINNGQYATFVKSLFSTFDDTHKNLFDAAKGNVHLMLDFLMGHKAQLDEQGKIPLAQLHDTVLDSLQFKGKWNPLNVTVTAADYTTTDGKITVTDTSKYNPLPGYKNYSDGDTLNTSGEYTPSAGDYYIVTVQSDIINLQYSSGYDSFELNTGDWIVYCDSQSKDSTSSGSSATGGYWTKIDNTDRMSAMSYNIDTDYTDNFWITPLTESLLTLVGTPELKASHKIGLRNAGNNSVEIVGKNLIDQLANEDSQVAYYPRYADDEGTIENGFISDEVAVDGVNHIHDQQTTNKTTFHSNVVIGVKDAERRDATIFGNVYIAPHLKADMTDGTTEKGIAEFTVVADGTTRTVNIFAQDGTANYGITEDKSDETVNIALPEHTSTIVGKLAGVDFETARITKSVTEGYIETSSIEEHVNSSTSTSNYHDSVENIVEFHSQVATPVTNTYEVIFGAYDTTGNKGYDNDDFTDTGALASKLLARLTNNKYQTESNIYVSLPVESGTLFTQENFRTLFGSDDDSYLVMFGDTQTLDGNGLKFDTLKKSPLRQIQNALRTRLIQAYTDKGVTETSVAQSTADTIAAAKGDGTFKSTTDTSVSDTVVENDVIVGSIDSTGKVIEKKSLIATKAIGVSNDDTVTGLIVPSRTNFTAAAQYYDPVTGEATTPVDVTVDMPNESGVMLTSNSRVDGGVWNN